VGFDRQFGSVHSPVETGLTLACPSWGQSVTLVTLLSVNETAGVNCVIVGSLEVGQEAPT